MVKNYQEFSVHEGLERAREFPYPDGLWKGELGYEELCRSEHDGYVCTLLKDHGVAHVAHGLTGPAAVWEDEVN